MKFNTAKHKLEQLDKDSVRRNDYRQEWADHKKNLQAKNKRAKTFQQQDF